MSADPRPDTRAAPAAASDFGEVYRLHVDYVWKSVHRLGARERDVEDLVHDVFVIAYRRLDSYDATLPMRRWLFGITFRVLAADKRRARHRVEIPSDHVDVADNASPHDEVSANRRLLMKVLAELPLEQRAVLIMHDVDGFSAPEIAEALEVPLNTAYSRLRLARAKFALAARRLGNQRGES